MSTVTTPVIGFAPHEVRTDVSAREARLKWVVVVDADLPAGLAANAAVCVAASTVDRVPGIVGPDAVDAAGDVHPGLPWIGCAVLGAPRERLAAVRTKAAAAFGVFVADMTQDGQRTLVYDEYRAAVGRGGEPRYLAISVVGPRNRVDKIVGGLPLLGR